MPIKDFTIWISQFGSHSVLLVSVTPGGFRLKYVASHNSEALDNTEG